MHEFGGLPIVRRLARDSFLLLAGAFILLRFLGVPPWDRAVDAYAYWATRDGSMYDGSLAGSLGAYLYSPAFAQLLAPIVWLPWTLFLGTWTTILLAAYGWTVRLAALPLLLFLPIPADLATGNVHLLYAAAIVVGFRFPAAWALLALTKVTPFIGVVWFAVRREWRSFAIACGVTLAITGVSFAVDPAAWRTWVDILLRSSSTPLDTPGWFLPVPLAFRLPVALLVVVAAARTDRAWLLPIGVTLALPVVWLNGLAILAACWPLRSKAAFDARSLVPGRAAAVAGPA
ncbi:MAG: glycosyltransferase family 87 protein [Candidatus Limnocylindrales bacterium]